MTISEVKILELAKEAIEKCGTGDDDFVLYFAALIQQASQPVEQQPTSTAGVRTPRTDAVWPKEVYDLLQNSRRELSLTLEEETIALKAELEITDAAQRTKLASAQADLVRTRETMPEVVSNIGELTGDAIERFRQLCRAELLAEQAASLDIEKIMQQWDYWRQRIANGDTTSAPRDWFESTIEWVAEQAAKPAEQQHLDATIDILE